MIRAMIEGVAGYPGLFLLCASSGIVLPVPEDIALLYAGSQLASGEMHWLPALFAACLGVLVRDLVVYGIGRLIGDWVLQQSVVHHVLGRKKVERARALVSERGASAVMAGRFLVGFRAPVFFVAGAMGVPLRKFLVWNALGLVVAVPGVVLLGYAFGAPLAEGAFWLVRHLRVAFGLGVVSAVVAFVWWRWRADRTPELDMGDEIALQADGTERTP